MNLKKYKKIILLICILVDILVPTFVIANDNSNINIEPNISYNTHIQNNGWENDFNKKNGQISGTSGQGLRLEAIKIKIDNMPNVDIRYQVHAQNIGWQEWKENGEIAGTSGQGLRLEAIKIKLINAPNYTVEYRVHVQNIGWQSWKQDGVVAGTSGQGLRLEAIQIRIVPKENKGTIKVETNLGNQSYFDKINVSGWKITNVENASLKIFVDNNDITDQLNIQYNKRNDLNGIISYGDDIINAKPGFKFILDATKFSVGTHKLEIKLLTNDNKIIGTSYINEFKTDKDIHILYKSHVQGIGWQDYLMDGGLSGTTGKFLRIEAINLKTYNLPQNVKLKYQAHVQGIGWQDWKDEGNFMGTIGQSKRIEAFRLKLDNQQDYTVEYRAHVQGIGWQNWKQDGAVSGTIGKFLRIEAIQIRIIKKVNKASVVIETNTQDKKFYEDIAIKGWKMTNVPNAKLKIFIDDDDITSNINLTYQIRNDLVEKIDYCSDIENEKPGFTFSINKDDIESGNHKLEVKLFSEDETTILSSISKNILVDKDIHILYQSHVQGIGWQDYSMDGGLSGTTGNGFRIEAMNIKAYNLPEGVNLKYQAHVEGIGWQPWKSNGEMIGTIGAFKRIEAIKIELENAEKYSIIYRAHVQDYGWQDWSNDGEMAGTAGVGKRIEAIQIKIVDKITEQRTKVYLDEIPNNLTNKVHRISGYIMTNVENVQLQLLIDNKKINTVLPRIWDQKVFNTVKGYGGEKLNPIPRFYIDIDFSKYSLGTHTATVQAILDEKVIKTQSRTFNTIKQIEYSIGTYGYSGLAINGNSNGSALRYYKYGSGPNVFFATFAVHGFEDSWYRDGQYLNGIADAFYNTLISRQDFEIADKWTIYILPEVNPDGARVGTTNNGPGRTTLYSKVGKGIDINRSWQTGNFYKRYTDKRNYNGTAGFQAYEAEALRDFLLSHKSSVGQNILVDLHGWENQLIGNEQVANYYKQYYNSCSTRNYGSYGTQYLISWARQNLGAKSTLVELPKANSENHANNMHLPENYIDATFKILKEL